MLNRLPVAKPSARVSTSLCLCTALAFVGCAGKPVEIGPLYQRLGGEAGVAVIVDDVMSNVENDPRIKESFAKADASKFKQTLAAQICDIGNGACAAPDASVQTTLRDLAIDNDQFDAFIGDFAKALDARDIGPETQRELLFPFKAMRGEVLGMVAGGGDAALASP